MSLLRINNHTAINPYQVDNVRNAHAGVPCVPGTPAQTVISMASGDEFIVDVSFDDVVVMINRATVGGDYEP